MCNLLSSRCSLVGCQVSTDQWLDLAEGDPTTGPCGEEVVVVEGALRPVHGALLFTLRCRENTRWLFVVLRSQTDV